MIKPIEIKLDKQYNRFFTEVIADFEALYVDKPFKIFLGGKNRGKSYAAFFAKNGMIEHLKELHRVAYIRNTLDEAINQKSFFLEQLKIIHPDRKFTSSKNGIVDYETKTEIVTFLSSKNYNKVSGNQSPYYCVFFDEFNQNLNNQTIKMLYQLPLILNTLFRTNSLNVWICGNTFSASSPIYDIFEINNIDVNTININDNFFMIRFNDEIFKETAFKNEGFFKSQSFYDSLFLGNEYETDNDLIIKNVPNSQLTFFNIYFKIASISYQLTMTVDKFYYIKKINKIERDKSSNIYCDNFEECILNNYQSFNNLQIYSYASLIRSKRIAFNDFNSFIAFSTVLQSLKEDDKLITKL